MSSVLLSVGDASADIYAGDFVRELRQLVPGTRIFGMGGAEMEKAGVEIRVEQGNLAVGGLFELLPDLHRVVGTWRKMVALLRSERPDLVVLMDSSGFNLPFARRARKLGIPTLYYVSPQVWAWRRGRMRKIARWVNRLAVILPFEPGVYEEAGLSAEFVGHPLVERLAQTRVSLTPARAREALGLADDAPTVALLPGSRRAEVRLMLPLMLDVARVLHARDPRLHFVVARSLSIGRNLVDEAVAQAGLPSLLPLSIVDGRAHEVMCAADVVFAKPGTSTLEAALLGRPLVVAIRASRLTAFVVRKLAKIPSYTMPNLIAGEAIVPEFVQEETDPERIADAIQALLSGPARERQLEQLAAVRGDLSKGGAARRAAEIAAEMLRGRLSA